MKNTLTIQYLPNFYTTLRKVVQENHGSKLRSLFKSDKDEVIVFLFDPKPLYELNTLDTMKLVKVLPVSGQPIYHTFVLTDKGKTVLEAYKKLNRLS